MSTSTKWQEHFQHQRKLNQLTVEDGKNMGIMLMIKKKEESVEKRLEAFLSKNEALQQLKLTRFPQIDVMVLALLQNKLFHKKARGGNKVAVEPQNSQLARIFRSPVSAVRTLNDLTEAEATKIGRSFKLLLLTTTEPAAAVDAWRLDNKVLVPLFADHAWFEPMINAIAKQVSEPSERALWKTRILADFKLTHSDSLKMRLASLRSAQLLQSSNLGLKWRVGLGVGLSMMDMISDSGVISTYQASGNTSEAYSLIAMIGSSLAAQILFTYAQNIKKSKWVKLRESAFIVTLLKPAVDGYRVATGHEDKDSTVNPLFEMVMGKMAELAFESIPGGLLQAYMFINSPEKTTFLLISILISTLTTGFASAMISYDMDVSVTTRKEVPLFYGYIKDSNTERGITFVLLILLASLHNLSRTIGTALLLSVSKELTFGIILAEHVLYHLYKIVRRDYVVWLVGLEGGVKYMVAFVAHSAVKVLVDYTGERVI